MKSNILYAVLCTTAIILSFTACSGKKSTEVKSSSEEKNSYSEENEKDEIINEFSKMEETKAVSADSIDGLNDTVIKEVEDSVVVINTEYEKIKSDIDTYSKYLSEADKMEAFYTKIYATHYSLCLKMCEYSLEYAEAIVNSDMSNDEKYDELEELYDSIYDDAGDEIYDEFYDGILEDIYDDFYDGLLEDAYDNKEYSEYSEWSDARSNEYKWWSDTRSNVYEDWSDMRSDVYEFWSDIRGELWDDDIEKANKKIADFREDIDKLSEDADKVISGSNYKFEESSTSDSAKDDKDNKDKVTENLVDGMRPEFKETLDSYEDFFDEYCDIIKKINKSPDDVSLLGVYTEYLTKYTETIEKMEALDDGEMNDAELKYYLKVTNRINVKLLDAAL